MYHYFKRQTNNGKLIPEIDGLRFFAIFTVVVYHLNTTFSESLGVNWKELLGVSHPLNVGWWLVRLDLGVKVFFAISGFILAIPFIKYFFQQGSKVILSDYFYRRLTRLEPPYLISLIGFYFVHIFFLHRNWLELIPNFLASFFYIHAFVFGQPSVINPVSWSLETEAQFYILIPFLIGFLFLIKTPKWFISTFLLFFGVSIYLKYEIITSGPPNLAYSILVYLNNFLTGCFFAWVYLQNSNYIKAKNYLWDIIGLIATFNLFYFYKPQAFWLNNIMFNSSIFFVFVAVFKGRLINWFYTRPIIYIIGGMCYTIYLLHFAFFHILIKYTSRVSLGKGYLLDLLLQFLLVTPVLMLVCAIFFLLIEKPCMKKDWPQQVRALFFKSKQQEIFGGANQK